MTIENGPTRSSAVEEWRWREVQAIGAAIATRNWHDVEQAYNALRDKMDRTLTADRVAAAIIPAEPEFPEELQDEIAWQMRQYYEANKPLHWWQKRQPAQDQCIADELMLGLLALARTGINAALSAR